MPIRRWFSRATEPPSNAGSALRLIRPTSNTRTTFLLAIGIYTNSEQSAGAVHYAGSFDPHNLARRQTRSGGLRRLPKS